ncbi:efflux RND transporter periplasmic adaptor subunit [Gaoshiqia sediminis]|uniref:Efflux RND transporter periplasmic adaptor subunit n=1 Tax=Gaoshiqia sediminis TaxID=2986998 RepID=A0AA42C768_9BACT|nr:efflux RND transporter periplasmic adaptor subunit [Gaoshiqia sediminis]MCW0484683.1 efflux RND transporter periplasmic adaptor subunit [Gaoshiqia sediminis]
MKSRVIVLLASLSLWACSHQHAHNESQDHKEASHNHDHENAEVKQTLVVYSEYYELFAEADPFVVGEEASVLAHFSGLPDFRPLEGASVQASLWVGGEVVAEAVGEPAQPGIYRFNLKPEASGAGFFSVKIEKGGKQSQSETAVVVFDDGHEAFHHFEEQEVDLAGAIAFTKEQSWKVDFATALPGMKPFGPVLKTTALVQPVPAQSHVLTAKTSGVVSYAVPNLVEGMPVRAGQPLFRVSGSGMGDDNASVVYASALANYEKEKADYERMAKLAEKQIVSQKDLLTAKNSYEKAKVVFQNLQKNFNAEGQTVRVPVASNIVRVMVANGEFVSAGQPVASLSQQGRIRLKAEVQQKYAADLQQISSVLLRAAGRQNWNSLDELNGKLLSVGTQISTGNFLLPVYFETDNNGDFLPGSLVEVNLKMVSESAALVVPNTALIEQEGNFFVFVQLDPEHFEKRQVTVGDTDGVETLIQNGLSPNERIVTKGAVLVKLAAVSNSLDPHAGHVH